MNSELIDDIREAIREDNKPEVVALSRGLTELFREHSRNMNRYRDLAHLVRQSAGPDSDITQAARNYLETAVNLTEQRSIVDKSLLIYLSGNSSPDSVITDIAGFEAQMEAEAEARDTLIKHKLELDLPAMLHLDVSERDFLPKGVEVSKEVELSNIGGDDAVEVSISTAGDLQFETSVDSIDRLQADQSVSFTVEGSPADNGEFELIISASGIETSASQSVTIIVLAKADYLETAQTELQRNKTILGEYVGDSSDNGENQRQGNRDRNVLDLQKTAAKLESALQRIETGLHVLNETDNADPVDSQIQTALRKLEEFRKHLKDVNADGVSTEDRTKLIGNALEAEGSLEVALDATI